MATVINAEIFSRLGEQLQQSRLLFDFTFLCVGSVQPAKFKGIITITGVAGFFNVGVFDLHAWDTSKCQKSLQP